ncbi:hypothetical protein HanIR_Chr01g0047711 [Helianthus annuus]|nr:hypothetical protein HanIR_Chr01g0047711 [Helianthus annuus]
MVSPRDGIGTVPVSKITGPNLKKTRYQIPYRIYLYNCIVRVFRNGTSFGTTFFLFYF